VVEHGSHCRTIRLEAGPVTYIPREHLESRQQFDRRSCQDAPLSRIPN